MALQDPAIGELEHVLRDHLHQLLSDALAKDAVPAYADNGVSRRYWTAPENPTGRFKMWIEMAWMRNGNHEGFARVEYDNHKRLWNGNVDYTTQYCLEDS